jgi:large subunit ribosomal protein L25
MESVVLSVQKRENLGSKSSRNSRRQGVIPVNIYGLGQESLAVLMEQKQLEVELKKPGFLSRVLTLDTGEGKQVAIARKVQLDPVTDRVLHIEFQRVDEKSKVRVKIPIHYINEEKSPGIKLGGILNIIVHRLEVSCSPHAIPEQFVVDLSGRSMNQSIHLEELQLPKEIQAIDLVRNRVLATIVAPKGSKEDKSESGSVTTP